MTAYVAMVRGVMPVGKGILPAARLKEMGEANGFGKVRTFIATGNLLFVDDRSEGTVLRLLEQQVADHFGRPTPVFVRTAAELAEAAAANPFSDDKPSRVMAHFIAEPPAKAMIDDARDVAGERIALGPRLLYVSYGDGIGKTRLKLPAVKLGTARNMNSVAKMAALLAEME